MQHRNPNWDKHTKKYGPEVTVKKYLDSGQIVKDDVELIKLFIANKRTKGQLGDAKAGVMTRSLVYWRKYITVPYREITLPIVETAIGALKSGTNEKGRPYSKNSQHDYIAYLKAFVLFMSRKKYISWSSEDIEELREIKTPAVDLNTTEPSELLSPDELKEIIRPLQNKMHAALVAVMYETGGRPIEIASLQWQDVTQDEDGYRVWLQDFKNGGRRTSRLTWSAAYLTAWRDVSPKTGKEDWVFIGRGKEPITWHAAETIWHRAAARVESAAGKRPSLYRMRKSRITTMHKEGYNESAIAESVWGNTSSRMRKIYVKLSADDVDAALLAGAGIVKEVKKTEHVLRNVVCPKCHKKNRATADVCDRCGTPISQRAIESAELETTRTRVELATELVRKEIKALEIDKLRAEIERLKGNAGA